MLPLNGVTVCDAPRALSPPKRRTRCVLPRWLDPTEGAWHSGKENSRKLARIANEYGARLSQEHPGKFGVFAAVPLPDVDGSLNEIEHAFDALHADGVGAGAIDDAGQFLMS